MDCNTPFDFAASGCSREVCDVRFKYFSTDEVRRISVQEINDIVSFDEWGAPLDNGLMSPALGPPRDENPCVTCGLSKDCPGHMGHIELACTLYNPFLFKTLYTLLQRTCLQCRRLKASIARTNGVVRQLSRLVPGEVAAAGGAQSAIDTAKTPWTSDCAADDGPRRVIWQDLRGGSKGKLVAEEDPMRSMQEHAEAAQHFATRCKEAAEGDDDAAQPSDVAKQGKRGEACLQTYSASLESVRGVLKEYCVEMKGVCQNCKKRTNKWKKEGFTALYLEQGGDFAFAVPAYVRDILLGVWRNEEAILKWLIPGIRDVGPEIFFLDALFVPPNRFRPMIPATRPGMPPIMGMQTVLLKEVLEANVAARKAFVTSQGDDGDGEALEDVEAPQQEEGNKEEEKEALRVKKLEACEALQAAVNSFMDGTKSGKNKYDEKDGIRQLFEKKEGLFRMKMMGKRVNYAARSVISPDPNIETSEIGIPLQIAAELSYPEVAGSHNVAMLRALVERGTQYPGATEVHIPQPNGGKSIIPLKRAMPDKRAALAKQLVTDLESGRAPWTVFRQLRDGDPLLVNRQPTLHKPGIMAHVAKVLAQNNTIRLHYVNCNTYNADFDGDELNLHAPQDPIGRIEALQIAKADYQYLVPTSGSPLRGLIQDYVIAGTMLTKRDTFFSREEVCLLLYAGLRAPVFEKGDDAPSELRPGGTAAPQGGCKPGAELEVMRATPKRRLQLDPPCIHRPREAWSGKQVFSMLLKNIVAAQAKGRERLRKSGNVSDLKFDGSSKTPGDIWNGKLDDNKEESSVLFQNMELLRGVLDKKQFGASGFGVIHLMFELFGSDVVAHVLGALVRLFTVVLQLRGFTCAFMDLLLRGETEVDRERLLRDSRAEAKAVSKQWLLRHNRNEVNDGDATCEMLSAAAEGLLDSQKPAEIFERMMIGKMKEGWTSMIKSCIPKGQKLPFPRNCFSAMVQTGAKGSMVNQSQICCCLGQQELEGRLPPLMSTMRSLPCFAPFDLGSRTRGYIADRFLTGIRPQEFFFHCMAGREGLVDTAVKTSRSGYLQRCLVKHLETLKVAYDHSVRDSDGSVLQFLYGEDGVDVTQSPYLFKFDEMRANFSELKASRTKPFKHFQTNSHLVNLGTAPAYLAAKDAMRNGDVKYARKQLEQLLADSSGSDRDPAVDQNIAAISKGIRREGAEAAELFDPVQSILTPAHFFGSTSERHEEELRKYLMQAKGRGLCSDKELEAFAQYMRLKFMQSLAQPGEAVGVIAAQSMGEPSTQMTLNTFHLAGHGGANVTLGIPRLREIVQTASKSCATPLMRLEVLRDEAGATDLASRQRFAQALQRSFRGVTILDCLARVAVHESAQLIRKRLMWTYQCRIEFLPIQKLCKRIPHITPKRLEAFVKGTVVRKLKRDLQRIIQATKVGRAAVTKQTAGDADMEDGGAAKDVDDTGGASDADNPEAETPAKAGPKPKKRRTGTGAADKNEAEEEAEAKADEDAAMEEDDVSENSGMYSDCEEDEEVLDDVPEQGAPQKGAKEPAEDEDDADVEPAVLPVRDAADSDGDADEAREDDAMESDEDAGATAKDKLDKGGGAEGKRARETDRGGGAEGKKAKASPAALSGAMDEGRAALDQALSSGQLVWNSALEGNTMTVVVAHRAAECPHRVCVAEMLHQICRTSEMQNPDCAGVQNAHIKVEDDRVWLECEGINFYALHSLPDEAVDHQRLYTNNFLNIYQTYGVEAARAAIVREIREVFGHYGIEVDRRHLSLIADYMTHSGTLRAFNRHGLAHNTSPMQQMSYETTCEFMGMAVNDAVPDTMVSPTSSIMLGQPPTVGTGIVSLLVDLNPPVPAWRQEPKFTW